MNLNPVFRVYILKSVHQRLESIVYVPAVLKTVTIRLVLEHDNFQAGEQVGLLNKQRSELKLTGALDQI
jgi:hypothetical protein